MTGTGRTWLKTILLLAGLAFGWPGFAARIAMLGISPGLALYAGLFLLLLACLWGTAFIARGWLRWGWALVFALATLFVDSFQAATAAARKSVVWCKWVSVRVYLGGRRELKKKKKN